MTREEKIAALKSHDASKMSREEKIAALTDADRDPSMAAAPKEQPGLLSKIGSGAAAVGNFLFGPAIEEAKEVGGQVKQLITSPSGFLEAKKKQFSEPIQDKSAVGGYSPIVETVVSGSVPFPEQLVPGIVKNIPTRLKELAVGSKLKQAGAIQKDFKKMVPGAPEKLYEFMKKNKIGTVGEGVEDVLIKTTSMKDTTGKTIGNIYKEYSEKLTDPAFLEKLSESQKKSFIEKMQNHSLDPEMMAERIAAEIAEQTTGKAGGRAAANAVNSELDNLRDAGRVAKEAKQPFMNKLFEYRKSLDDKIAKVYQKLPKDRTPQDDALLSLRGSVQKQIDNHIGALDEFFGTKELKKLKDASEQYKNLAKVHDLARQGVARTAGNRYFGLTESIAGSAAAGGELARTKDLSADNLLRAATLGLGTAIVGRAARRYGPGLLSKGAELGSQVTAPLASPGGLPGLLGSAYHQNSKEK